jgi:hypothetical protein
VIVADGQERVKTLLRDRAGRFRLGSAAYAPAVKGNVLIATFIENGIPCVIGTFILAAIPWVALVWAVRRGAAQHQCIVGRIEVQAHDVAPLLHEERIGGKLEALGAMRLQTEQKALYIDCGKKDQFNLLYGARRFVRRLNQLGIAHRYEEFLDNHTGVDYRMDESLPFLAQALSG